MITLYDYIYWGDYNERIAELANMVIPEYWDFSKQDQLDKKYLILKSYLSATFYRLYQENKIIATEQYCTFNTGLYTENYEEIYVFALPRQNIYYPNSKYAFECFCTQYQLGRLKVALLPQRADYFQKPELLIFNHKYPIFIQYEHILYDENNRKRLPKIILENELPLQTLIGCIELSLKKVIANYKLAIPQYYNGKIQLLIPIYFADDNKPELALVLTQTEDNYYLGHTCLTLQMAYNNARVIAKPDNSWLSSLL